MALSCCRDDISMSWCGGVVLATEWHWWPSLDRRESVPMKKGETKHQHCYLSRSQDCLSSVAGWSEVGELHATFARRSSPAQVSLVSTSMLKCQTLLRQVPELKSLEGQAIEAECKAEWSCGEVGCHHSCMRGMKRNMTAIKAS